MQHFGLVPKVGGMAYTANSSILLFAGAMFFFVHVFYTGVYTDNIACYNDIIKNTK